MLLAPLFGALLPVLSASGAGAVESDAAVFAVRLSRPSRTAVSVRFRTVDGTAHAGDDYSPRSGVLVFRPGRRVQRIAIATRDDADAEPEETFSIVFTRPHGARLRTPAAAGRISASDLPAAFVLRAQMSGADEPPSFASATGRGNATVTLDPARETVAYDMTIVGMDPWLAGICRGSPGELATDVRQFEGTFTGGRLTGTVPLELAQILEIYRTPERFCARAVDHNNEFIRGYLQRG